MQPNENPQSTPPISPDPPSPVPGPEPGVAPRPEFQPDKIAQQAFQPSTPAQPAQPVMGSVQPTAQPSQPAMGSVQPTAQSMQAPVQQSTDPTQIGYVPPVASGSMPLNMPNFNDSGAKKPSKFTLPVKIILGIVVALIFSAGSFTLLKDTLFSGSKIEISDLREESVDGLNFSRPKDWVEIDEPDYVGAFTEGGKPLDEADQAVLVLSQDIGGDFSELTDEEKAEFEKALKDNFANTDTLTEESSCDEVASTKVEKIQHKNFPLAYEIELVCSKFTGRNVAGEFRGVLAIKSDKLDLVSVTAIDKTWDKSGEALQYILDNFSRN